MTSTTPSHVTLYEVGPRDGLQNIAATIAVDVKVRFIEALASAGLGAIEAGAFVSPSAVPQMAGTADVFAGVQRRAGVRYTALVPNERGLDAALAAGVGEIAVFTAASETFNRKNINASIAESIERFRPVLQRAGKHNLRVRGYVSTCFGCPYEGDVDPGRVIDVTQRLFDLGVQEVSLGDTIGVAVPTQIEPVVAPILKRHGVSAIALHFHDTRGTAVANVVESLRLGVRTFDASAGGLGGCPYAPGAAGNVATEDLVYLFDRMGVATGVILDALVDASLIVERALGVPLPSRVLRAKVAEMQRRSGGMD